MKELRKVTPFFVPGGGVWWWVFSPPLLVFGILNLEKGALEKR